jgi:DnaJ like chaperone protein
MGWVGKLLGGTLGFAIGGPLGAILGAALGHGFDWGTKNLRSEYGGRRGPIRRSQLTFFVATFSMLSKLSEADGYVSPEELKTIDEFMTRELGLDQPSRETAARIFNAARSSPEGFEDFALQFYGEFHERRQLLLVMVDILVRVAVSDGAMGTAEEAMIRSAVSIFDIDEIQYRAILSRYSSQIDRYYTILQSERADSNDEIKRRYRRLANEYHPDKIASKGLPEEFSHYASEKFREIQEAYEHVRAERGF